MQQLIREAKHVDTEILAFPEKYGAFVVIAEMRKARHNASLALRLTLRYSETGNRHPDPEFDAIIQDLRSHAILLQSAAFAVNFKVLFGNGTRKDIINRFCDTYQDLTSAACLLCIAESPSDIRRLEVAL